ncbi:hypothetical protein B296_00034153 [Ensete ventricosum]|uniref:Uncharacterized protein n=1 Tax=Ensete ventricosum TaxID=4639 RepID=A0A426ZNZ3_ENSVE|nr:hypothetical protein B296_00034153 [Ensete ventricosum]
MSSSFMEGKEHQLPIATATSAKAQTKVLDSVVAMKALSKLGGFHAGYFRISLSLCGQALLWKTLSELSTDSRAIRLVVRLLPSATYVLLWSVALAVLVALCFLYALRCFLRFRCVKAEFSHHVGVNYLFAPWISWLLLLQSTPAFLHPDAALYRVLWWVFSVPILILDVKIYGQWFTEGKKFLSMVANPTSQITVIGNLVGARAAARMRWEEIATCMFSLGMAHYLVLFVTLYQRFVGCNSLPAMLRPVFFLFIAAPSMASLAWDSISGSFGTGSKMLFFLSLFLFASLVITIYFANLFPSRIAIMYCVAHTFHSSYSPCKKVKNASPAIPFHAHSSSHRVGWLDAIDRLPVQVSRPALFKRSMRRFNVAWWAYSFPLTVLALAATEYAQEVEGGVSNALMLVLAVLSVLVTVALIVFTAIKARDLLPHGNDPFAPPCSP